MATTRVSLDTRTFLAAHNLLDDGVDFERVRLRVGGPGTWYLKLVRRGALTTGDTIWFRNGTKLASMPLIAHELVHVAQYRRMGVIRFVAAYLRDFAKAGFRYSRSLPLEKVAYDRQRATEEALGLG
jgi:hypothetical protein